MVKRWTKAETRGLDKLIASSAINPNRRDAAYIDIGDTVSGEHFPEYKAPPPSGRQTAIVRFHRLFACIRFERELQGHGSAASLEGGEGKSLVICNALLRLAINQILCSCFAHRRRGHQP